MVRSPQWRRTSAAGRGEINAFSCAVVVLDAGGGMALWVSERMRKRVFIFVEDGDVMVV